jgi:hypothetical protein
MLARGARCEITGLVAAAQHNGTRCTLTEFHTTSGRWEVQLDGGAALRVKSENLIGIVAPVQGLPSIPTFLSRTPHPLALRSGVLCLGLEGGACTYRRSAAAG